MDLTNLFTLRLEGVREVGMDEESIPAWSKLLGTLYINEVPHHFEAWAVEYREDKNSIVEGQFPISPYTNHDEICNAMELSGGQTVAINGHQYFLCITPFEE